MRPTLSLLVFVLLSMGAFSQNDGWASLPHSEVTTSVVDSPSNSLSTKQPGDVTISTPANVERLLKDYGDHDHPQNGYRVQIFLGDRKTAEETKRAYLQKNPDVPAYLSWLAPNFRLRVGDLRTRLEAEHLLNQLKVAYPGSYIVPDEIGMPRVE